MTGPKVASTGILAAVIAIALGASAATAAGSLAFHANGEALATEGFVGDALTRDGWALRFEHVFVTVTDVAAHQTEPPFEPGSGMAPQATQSVPLPGIFTVDLLDVGADGRVLVGTAEAPAGQYNALTWSLVPAETGAHAGATMVLIGTAEKDGQTVPFTLRSADRHNHVCGEYVGDLRKGVVVDGGTADVEMTFHLDHLFGRSDVAGDDPMNLQAIGFGPFAGGGAQSFELGDLHVGHVGEGACDVVHG